MRQVSVHEAQVAVDSGLLARLLEAVERPLSRPLTRFKRSFRRRTLDDPCEEHLCVSLSNSIMNFNHKKSIQTSSKKHFIKM